MAAVEITISGVMYDKYNRTQQNVVIFGEASLTGLQVGGGPIIPPGQPGGGNRPSHPIALPGDPWWGQDLRPEHPIVTPPTEPPDVPPDTPPGTVVKPPPDDGGWGYVHPYGWAYFPGDTEAGPKGRSARR